MIFKQHKGSTLWRISLLENSRFSVFVHKITEIDDPRAYPHDHGCDFLSIGLRGWYTETLFDDKRDLSSSREVRRGAGSFHIMRNSQAHFISRMGGNAYTLFITFNYTGRSPRAWTPEGPVTMYEMYSKLGYGVPEKEEA